jgi:hypothetical protein
VGEETRQKENSTPKNQQLLMSLRIDRKIVAVYVFAADLEELN